MNANQIYMTLKNMANNLEKENWTHRAKLLNDVANYVYDSQLALRSVEWQGGEIGNKCPYCGASNTGKHKDNCKIDKLLYGEVV